MRAKQPALGVLPAHERLHAGDAPTPQVNLGLVAEDELASLERPPDLAEQDQPIRVEVVARGRVHMDPARARARAGERGVGALEQQLGAIGVLVHDRDADARLDVERHAVDHHRRLEAPLHGGGDATRPLLSIRVPAEDRELVGAEPGQLGSTVERLAAGAARPRSSTRSPFDVTERVVDLREAVEVDQQHRHAARPRAAARRTVRATLSMNSVRFGSP